jgi:hypothetical protein
MAIVVGLGRKNETSVAIAEPSLKSPIQQPHLRCEKKRRSVSSNLKPKKIAATRRRATASARTSLEVSAGWASPSSRGLWGSIALLPSPALLEPEPLAVGRTTVGCTSACPGELMLKISQWLESS